MQECYPCPSYTLAGQLHTEALLAEERKRLHFSNGFDPGPHCELIMLGPWMVSSQKGFDHGRHHAWALDTMDHGRHHDWAMDVSFSEWIDTEKIRQDRRKSKIMPSGTAETSAKLNDVVSIKRWQTCRKFELCTRNRKRKHNQHEHFKSTCGKSRRHHKLEATRMRGM